MGNYKQMHCDWKDLRLQTKETNQNTFCGFAEKHTDIAWGFSSRCNLNQGLRLAILTLSMYMSNRVIARQQLFKVPFSAWGMKAREHERKVLPVNHKRPDDCCQQDFVSSEGKGTPMKKERKMRANDDSETLSEVPVPRMGAIEISHAVEDVKLQEV